MEPLTVVCNGACTLTHVVSVPPFDLSVDDAKALLPAILMVWVIGWGVRQLVILIRQTGPDKPNED